MEMKKKILGMAVLLMILPITYGASRTPKAEKCQAYRIDLSVDSFVTVVYCGKRANPTAIVSHNGKTNVQVDVNRLSVSRTSPSLYYGGTHKDQSTKQDGEFEGVDTPGEFAPVARRKSRPHYIKCNRGHRHQLAQMGVVQGSMHGTLRDVFVLRMIDGK
jgi:hypothetical protein